MKTWKVNFCFTLGLGVPVRGDDVLDDPGFIRGMEGEIKGSHWGTDADLEVAVVEALSGRRVCVVGYLRSTGGLREVEDVAWDLFYTAAELAWPRLMEDAAYNHGGVELLDEDPRTTVDDDDSFDLVALEFINEHRSAIGQPILDPAAVGWTHDDVIAEAQRLRRLEGMMPNVHVRALERRLR